MNAPTNGGDGGIPTMYNGVLFRSRNEARFACLFDNMLIPWQYEVEELSGYIPDFTIHADLLAEIKPTLNNKALRKAQLKIENSGWDGEAVILMPFNDRCAHQPIVGSFGEKVLGPDGWQLEWSTGRIMKCLNCGWPSFFPESGSWHCRRCGVNGGNAHVGSIGGWYSRAWIAAGNLTQWRPS